MAVIALMGLSLIEAGQVRGKHNDLPMSKGIIIISMTTITLFVIGYGLSVNSKGGIVG